jgi:transcriptional antiterminator
MKDYKLKLLQSYGIGRLIKDFCLISNVNLTDNEIYKNIISLEKKYLMEIEKKESLINQLEIKF